VIADGTSVTDVAAEWRVSRQTMHTWLARYEAGGLEHLADRSHRPASCPHQMPAEVEAMALEMRRWKPYWGPRQLVLELRRRRAPMVPSDEHHSGRPESDAQERRRASQLQRVNGLRFDYSAGHPRSTYIVSMSTRRPCLPRSRLPSGETGERTPFK
jgi:Homeodomain-like domain